MANGNALSTIILLGGLAVVGYAFKDEILKLLNFQGGGGGGGILPTKLVVSPPVFQAVATSNTGALIAGPGGTLPINDAVNVAVVVPLSVSNPTSGQLFLATRMRLWRKIPLFPDSDWVVVGPQGITSVNSFISVLDPIATPSTPIGIAPSIVNQNMGLGIGLQGPAFGLVEQGVWFTADNPTLGFTIEILQLPSPIHVDGIVLAQKTWDPAFSVIT